jgi:hypothetical protein
MEEPRCFCRRVRSDSDQVGHIVLKLLPGDIGSASPGGVKAL